MAQWVITKIQNQIYFTADPYTPYPTKEPNGPQFIDQSPNLFSVQYTTACNNQIKIGLATGGFKAISSATIAHFLSGYMRDLQQRRPILDNYDAVLDDLTLYLDKITFTTGFKGSEYVLSQTNIGVGMYFNETTSIGGYSCGDTLDEDIDNDYGVFADFADFADFGAIVDEGRYGSFDGIYMDYCFWGDIWPRMLNNATNDKTLDLPLKTSLLPWLEAQNPLKLGKEVISQAEYNGKALERNCEIIAINPHGIQLLESARTMSNPLLTRRWADSNPCRTMTSAPNPVIPLKMNL